MKASKALELTNDNAGLKGIDNRIKHAAKMGARLISIIFDELGYMGISESRLYKRYDDQGYDVMRGIESSSYIISW